MWAAIVIALGSIIVIVVKKPFKTPVKSKADKEISADSSVDSSRTSAIGKHSGSQGMKTLSTSEASSNAVSQEGENFQIQGLVVDAKDRNSAVSGVQINCMNCVSSGVVVTTDASGHFKLPYRIKTNGSPQRIALRLIKDKKTVKTEEPVGQTNVTIGF